MKVFRIVAAFATCSLLSQGACASQALEILSYSVQAGLSSSVSDKGVEESAFFSEAEQSAWLAEKAGKLEKVIPDRNERLSFLQSVHYEASRAGLDPELVLGLIQIESGFRKYAVSSVGAQGYMQIMPFWVPTIGKKNDDLFHLRTNLRYGCTILRYYLDMEKGDLFMALGRYNGSRGKAKYPSLVYSAWSQWKATPTAKEIALN